MKLFSARHEYDYSWEEVSTNNWRKYCPWNDKAEHVIGVDVLNRSLDSKTGIVSSTYHFPKGGPLLTRLPTAPHRAPHYLQTGPAHMAQILLRIKRYQPRLRSLLRQPTREIRHNVLPELDLERAPISARDRPLHCREHPWQDDFRPDG
jgi:hypothetical protein